MIKEVIGRCFVLFSYVWLVHISEWYQNIPYGDTSFRGLVTVAILFGIVFWVGVPILGVKRNG